MWGYFKGLTPMAIEPTVVDVDGGFLHQLNIDNHVVRFLVEDLEPSRITEERERRAGVEFKTIFGIERPYVAPKMGHVRAFRIVKIGC